MRNNHAANTLLLVPRPLRKLISSGSRRYCPLCDSSLAYFVDYGNPARKAAMCPVCRGLERHRLIWLYMKQKTDLLDGKPKKMLHVAPEKQLSGLLSRQPGLDYLSVDMEPGKAMMQADITRLQFADNSFDVIYCSHVLEHVPDDRKAMSEFRRILKPGGWAILQVPISRETTYEDFSITDPKERERAFGQTDHVRVYGRDYEERLRSVGFGVTVDEYVRQFSPAEVQKMNLPLDESIYLCCKS